ncbi:MAG: TolC family protein [Desulfuromonas sp.]|nr:TolC family protein [Desulfuromonas sp.]
MIKIVITILTLLVVLHSSSGILHAVELSEAQRIACLYSDQAQIIAAERQADDAGARRTTAFARPQLNGYASWFKIDSNDDNPLFEVPKRELTAGIKASQLLFAGGRLWRSNQLRDNLHQLAQLQQRSSIRELEQSVALAFIDVQRQQQIHAIARDRLQQRQQELGDASALFEVGSVPHLDVREAELAVKQAQNDLQTVDSELFVAITTFNQQLGRAANEKQLTPSGNLEPQPMIDTLLITLAQQINANSQLDLLSSRTTTDIRHRQQQMAAGEHWPTLAVAASGETQGEQRDELDETWTIGLQLDWTLLSGGEIRANNAQAHAETQRAYASQQQTYKQLLASLANLEQQHNDLIEQIKRQQQAIQLADANYADARALYTEGTITLTHLGQFNLAYAESRFSLTQMLYAHNRLYHELRGLVEERNL